MEASSSRTVQVKRRDGSHNDVIVLSDSDDEVYYAQPRRKRRKISSVYPGPLNNADGLSHLRNGGPSLKFTSVDIHEKHQRLAADDGQSPGRTHGEQKPAQQNGQLARDLFPEWSDMLETGATDQTDLFLSQVLEVLPDVQPDHALALISSLRDSDVDNVVEMALHSLFENSYPKIERDKGKRKRDTTYDGEIDEQGPEVDYFSSERDLRGGPNYVENAFEQLLADFPFIPKPHVRKAHIKNRFLYAPSYLQLSRELQMEIPPFRCKVTPNKMSSKGKAYDAELERERQWVLRHHEPPNFLNKADPPLTVGASNEDEDCGDIECGCCFSTYTFEKMIQCPEAHLFCMTCMKAYVSDRLGQHNPKIVCMDQSGCKAVFTDSELERFLDEKMLSLYHRIKQIKEIEAAGLDGLEECPFCDYKVVIENPEEKLFRCEKEDCMSISCRSCKKLDHLPKSCKEAEEDQGLDVRHKVEEAMTEALMRNCPKCNKPFVKEAGCNKMTCPHCNALSCYICRKSIAGYEHFDHRPASSIKRSTKKGDKCLLWDHVEERHDDDVNLARQRAIDELSLENPEIDKTVLEVHLPQASNPKVQISQVRRVRAGRVDLRNARPIFNRRNPRRPFMDDVRRARANAALGDQERIAAAMAHVPPPPLFNGIAVQMHFGALQAPPGAHWVQPVGGQNIQHHPHTFVNLAGNPMQELRGVERR